MRTVRRQRFTLIEYGSPTNLINLISTSAQIPPSKTSQLLLAAGQRIQRSLNLSNNPIAVDSTGVRATDIAGLVRLGTSIELEIAPKFLGKNDQEWREDFFFLLTLSRHGRLFPADRIGAASRSGQDLLSLIARSMATMYWDNHRRPIRSYRRLREEDFFIDGEIDPVELKFPTENGFEQELTRFDRSNAYNAVISAAARELCPLLSDQQSLEQLVRVARHLGIQPKPQTARPKRLPSRVQSWQPLYDLSLDVLNGLGLAYELGPSSAHGYVAYTWRVWEDLITIAANLGFKDERVHSQTSFRLGHRRSHPVTSVSALNVNPDLVIEPNIQPPPGFLIDAKYKGRADQGRPRISESDIYQSLAFAKATKYDTIILAYPRIPVDSSLGIGAVDVFEVITVDSIRIVGVQVEVRGISKRQGLSNFARRFSQDILTVCKTI